MGYGRGGGREDVNDDIWGGGRGGRGVVVTVCDVALRKGERGGRVREGVRGWR